MTAFLRRRLRASALAFSVVTAAACAPTNPFDPDAPAALQATASLTAVIVLVNPDADDATLERDLAAARVGLVDDAGARVQRDGGDLALTLSDVGAAGGKLFIGDLTPGTYTIVVDNLSAYTPPALPPVKLLPGAAADIGTLKFVLNEQSGPGPGAISGEVDVSSGGAQRKVSLFKKSAAGVVLAESTVTGGAFDFVGLNPGRYALVAEASGFTSDYRLDIDVGEGGAAALSFDFSGADALHLFPVTAVLAPQPSPTTLLDEGTFFVSDDHLSLAVLAFGGVTSMRIATNADFVDDAGAALPFVPYAAAADVALPDRQGPITIFAQFEATSDGGFTFTSDTFTTTVVRDTTAPSVVDAAFSGLADDGAGTLLANLVTGATPGLRIDAQDDVSAVAGVAVIVSDTDTEPAPQTFDDVTSAGGLVRLDRAVPLGEDGAHFVFVFVRDRAGNVSSAARLPVLLDRTAPDVPLVVDNAAGGVLDTRLARLRFDVASAAADLPVAMQVAAGTAAPNAEIVPFTETVDVLVPPSFVHDQDVAFEARLIDAAGNTSTVRSLDAHLSLLSRVTGAASFEGVPEIAADAAGAAVRILDAAGAPLAGAATTTDAGGAFAISGIPEGRGAFLDVQREGWAPARVRLPVLPTLSAAEPATVLDPVALALLRGSLAGVFRRSDLAADTAAHAGIVVTATLVSPDRTFSASTVTGPDGSFTLRDLPATRASGESFSLEARRDDYGSATATAAVVAGALTPVSPDAGGVPQPVLLPKNTGDFDVCAVGGACVASTFFKDATVRIKLRDTAGVVQIRAQARSAFAAGDVDPPFQAFPAGNDFTVDISGADGFVDIFVQVKKSDDSTSEVLTSTILRDTVPPVLQEVRRLTAAGAVDARFTKNNFVDVVIGADPGTGAVAPLAPARVAILADDGSAAPAAPPGSASSCTAAISCRVQLPGAATNTVAEALHRVAGWACDAAGNCSAPLLSFVIHDHTPPSAAHGAGFAITGAAAVQGGVSLLRSPLYGISLATGAAKTAGGAAVVDENGAAVADVFASRFSFTETTTDATLRALDPSPAASSQRADVTVPALPAVDGDFRLFGQLVDAAGNATSAEPNAFFHDLRLDTQPPAVAFSVNGGADVTASATVSVDVVVPAGGEVPDHVDLAADGGLFATGVVEKAFPLDPAGETFTLPSNGDGAYTVFARFFDAAGNVVERSDAVVLDTTAPAVNSVACASCSASGGALFARSTTAQLAVSASDGAGTGVVSLRVDVKDANNAANSTSATVPFTGGAAVTLFANTENDVTVRGVDRAGNTTALAAAGSVRIVVDTVAPAVTALTVNGVTNAVTNNPVVTVAVTASADTTGMALANGSLDCAAATYTAFASPVQFTLAGASPVTVSLCLQDRAGNTSTTGANTRSVTLDTTPPSGSVSINGGAASSTSRAVTLTIDTTPAESNLSKAIANDAVDCQSASFSALGAVPAAVAHTLSAGDGARTVFVCFKDPAGNISVASDGILVDTADPIGAIAIVDPEGNNDGFANTANITVALSLPGEDTATAQMAVREAAVLDCTSAALTYEGFASTKVLALAGGQGLRTVSACFKDAAGRVTPAAAVAHASITLDSAPPTGALDVAEGRTVGGTHFVSSTAVTAIVGGTSADVVGLAISTSALNCNTATFGAFSAATPVVLAIGEGDKTINACLRDASGLRTALSTTVRLDTTGPAGAITLDGGADYTADRDVDVRVTSAEANLELKLPAADCAPPFNIAPFDGDEARTITVSGAEGTRTIGACLRDPAGNTAFLADAVNLDLTAPVGLSATCASCLADAGALFTAGVDVTGDGAVDAAVLLGNVEAVDPNANGFVQSVVARVDLNNDGDTNDTVGGVAETQIEDYDSFVPVRLAATNRAFAIHLTFIDAAGNESGELDFDGGAAGVQPLVVTLDTVAPSSSISFTATGRRGDGTTSTSTTVTQNVLLAFGLTAGDDVVAAIVTEGVSFAGLTPRPLADLLGSPFALSGGDGTKTLRARLFDRAGNAVTLTSTPSLVLDTAPPTLGTVVIAGGAAAVNSANVTVALSAQGATKMRVAFDGVIDTEPVIAFAASASGALSAGDGNKTVAAVFLDDALNSTTIATDTVTLDTAAPTSPSIVVNGGAGFTNSTSVTLSLSAVGATEMRTRVDAAFDSEVFVPLAATATALLPAGDCSALGCKTVCAEFRDGAGNVSPTVCDSITLDASPPAVPVITTQTGVVPATAFQLALASEPADAFFGGYEVVVDPGDNGVFATKAPIAGSPPRFNLSLTAPSGSAAATASQGNLIRIRAFDQAGNRSVEATVAVAVDPVAPDPPVPQVTSAVVNADTFAVFFGANNPAAADANFAGYEIAVVSPGRPTPSFTPTALVDGLIFTLEQGDDVACTSPCQNRLQLRAKDAAGNRSGVVEVVVDEDSTFPTPPRLLPRGARITGVDVFMRLDQISQDNGGEVAKYEVVGGDKPSFVAVDPPVFKFGLDRRDFSHQLCIRGKDAAGNVSTTDCVVVEQRSAIPIANNGVDENRPSIFGDLVAYQDLDQGTVISDLRSGASALLDANGDDPRLDGDRDTINVVWRSNNEARLLPLAVDGLGAEVAAGVSVPSCVKSCAPNVNGVGSIDISGSDVAMIGQDVSGTGVFVNDASECRNNLTPCFEGVPANATRLTSTSKNIQICRGRQDAHVRVHGGVIVWCEDNAGAFEIHRFRLGVTPIGSDELIATSVVGGTEGSPHQPVITDDGLYWASGSDLCRIDAGAAVGAPFVGCPAAQQVVTGEVGLLTGGDGDRIAFTVGESVLTDPIDAALFERSTGDVTRVTDDILDQADVEVWRSRVAYADRQRFSDDIVVRDLTEGTFIVADPNLQGAPRADDDFIVWVDLRNGVLQLFKFDLVTEQESPVTGDTENLGAGDSIYDFKNGIAAFTTLNLATGRADRLFVMNVATGARTQVDANSAGFEAPMLNDDASRVFWFDDGDLRVKTAALSGAGGVTAGAPQNVGGVGQRIRRMAAAGNTVMYEDSPGNGPSTLGCAQVGSTTTKVVDTDVRTLDAATVSGIGVVVAYGAANNTEIRACALDCSGAVAVCSPVTLAGGSGTVQSPTVSTSGFITWVSNQDGDGFGQVAVYDALLDQRYRLDTDFGVDGSTPVVDAQVSGNRVVWSGFAFGNSDIFTAVLGD